jgi:hypothetical protein
MAETHAIGTKQIPAQRKASLGPENLLLKSIIDEDVETAPGKLCPAKSDNRLQAGVRGFRPSIG